MCTWHFRTTKHLRIYSTFPNYPTLGIYLTFANVITCSSSTPLPSPSPLPPPLSPPLCLPLSPHNTRYLLDISQLPNTWYLTFPNHPTFLIYSTFPNYPLGIYLTSPNHPTFLIYLTFPNYPTLGTYSAVNILPWLSLDNMTSKVFRTLFQINFYTFPIFIGLLIILAHHSLA